MNRWFIFVKVDKRADVRKYCKNISFAKENTYPTFNVKAIVKREEKKNKTETKQKKKYLQRRIGWNINYACDLCLNDCKREINKQEMLERHLKI